MKGHDGPHSLENFHTGHPHAGPTAPLVDAPPRDVSAGPRPRLVPRSLFLLSTVATIMGLTFGTLAALVVSPISMLAGSAAWRLGVICDGIARWSAFCFVEEMWLLYAVRRKRQHRFVENSNRAQRAFALYGAASAASAVGYAMRIKSHRRRFAA